MSAHPCETVCANQMPIRILFGLQKRRRDSWGLVAEKVLSLEANKDTATAGERAQRYGRHGHPWSHLKGEVSESSIIDGT